MPAGWAAAIGAVGSIAGSAISAGAASDAASQQAAAAQRSQDLQQKNFNTVLGNEAPFLQAGQGATSQLNYLLGNGTPGQSGTAASSTGGGFGSLNQGFNADTFKTMSPAYQFSLQQGGQGVLNQNSSGQGALSGAAMKDLTAFNSNYANNSFNNAFNQYQTQQNNVFNRLNSVATMGQNAASNQATGASSFSAGIGQSAQNVGTALGAGTAAAGNALAGGVTSAGNWLAGAAAGNAGNAPFTPTFDASLGAALGQGNTPINTNLNTMPIG